MRDLADDFVTTAKDGLRGLRFAIRRKAGEAGGSDGVGIAHPRRAAAKIADDVLSAAEGLALTVLAPVAGERAAWRPRPLQSGLLAPDRPEERRRRDHAAASYAFLRHITDRHGARAVLISEQALRRALAEVPLPATAADPIRVAAALARTLASARPVRDVVFDPAARRVPAPLRDDPDAFAALVLGLVEALVSSRPALVREDPDVLLAAAEAAVAIRFARLSRGLATDDETALADAYAALVPFLP